jgi:hypothetical protein
LALSDPILLDVHVPRKNQPVHHGIDDIPTDDYQVWWDGVTAIVLWSQKSASTPMSGGHVIADILNEALAKTGAKLHIQACRPSCDNIFFHVDLRVLLTNVDKARNTKVVSQQGFDVRVETPQLPGRFGLIRALGYGLGLHARDFGEVKSLGRRIIDMEAATRGQMDHLLQHYYDYSKLWSIPIIRRLKARWKMIGWRREARHLIAGLWLSMSNIEMLSRQWNDVREEFEEGLNDNNLQVIFSRDYLKEKSKIESIDLGHFEATIDQVAARFDNRAVILATVGGALSGGLAGALASLIH